MHVGPGRDFPFKRQLIAGLRATGLLPLAEGAYGVREVLRWRAANIAYAREHPDTVFPPARLIQRTYGTPSYQSFREWGRQNAEEIGAVIDQLDTPSRPQVLEWGCGLGRLAVHLERRFAYTGVDIDPGAIRWCAEHLEGRYTLNRRSPPLPFAEDSWDVVFAVSIFTHLSEAAHLAWRDDVFRVLKPGGYFVFTVHGEAQSTDLSSAERTRFARGELVVRGGVAVGSRTYLAYHPPAYVTGQLLAGFELVRGPEAACSQTLYVARKPV